jgi:uncharacterized membrane protein YiaA
MAIPAISFVALSVGVACFAVTGWRGDFPRRGWFIGCAVLALCAAAYGVSSVLPNMHDLHFCRIEL